MKFVIPILAFLAIASIDSKPANAALFELPVLDPTMTTPIFRIVTGGLALKPIEPASDLGKTFGLYVGASASLIDLSSATSIFQNTGSYLPSVDFQVGLGLPLGLTLEAAILPALSLNGTSISKYSGAIKWTITRTLLSMLPLDIATRFSYTSGNIAHTQPLSGGTINISYGTSIFSGQILVSKSLVVIEPYVGLGLLSHSSTLAASGTSNLFGGFPAGTQSVDGSELSTWFQAGLLFKLAIFGISAEYDNIYGISSFGSKVSFRF